MMEILLMQQFNNSNNCAKECFNMEKEEKIKFVIKKGDKLIEIDSEEGKQYSKEMDEKYKDIFPDQGRYRLNAYMNEWKELQKGFIENQKEWDEISGRRKKENIPNDDDIYLCSRCEKPVLYKDLLKYKNISNSASISGSHTVIKTYCSVEGLCKQCYMHNKKIEKYFTISYWIIDIVIALTGAILYFNGIIKDGVIACFLVGLLAVPFFGNDIFKQAYLELDSYFAKKRKQ